MIYVLDFDERSLDLVFERGIGFHGKIKKFLKCGRLGFNGRVFFEIFWIEDVLGNGLFYTTDLVLIDLEV
jgi:hypothetical protein